MSDDKKEKLNTISKEIEKLKELIDKDQEAIKKINELLRKADMRLREETEHYDRWMSVIENLENSLIETRRILQGRTIRLQQLQKEYQELLINTSMENPVLPELPLTKEEQEIIKEKAVEDNRLASEVIGISAEKWGEVSLGELSQIIISMKSSIGEKTVQDNARGEAITEKSEEEIEKTIKSETIFLQLRNLLASGLNKVWNNKVESLTSQEKAIILKVYQHMENKKNKTAKEDRLFRVISAAVRIAFSKHRPI